MRCVSIIPLFLFSVFVAGAFDFTPEGIGGTFKAKIVNDASKTEEQITLKQGENALLQCQWLVKQGFKPFSINGDGSGTDESRVWSFSGSGKNEKKDVVSVTGKATSEKGVEKLISLTIKIIRNNVTEEVWTLKPDAKKASEDEEPNKKTSEKKRAPITNGKSNAGKP